MTALQGGRWTKFIKSDVPLYSSSDPRTATIQDVMIN